MTVPSRGGSVSHTQHVARRYYDAWTSGDSHSVAALLSPAFLDSGAFPRDATVMMVAEDHR
jgi:hypothetical protein